MTKFAIRNEQHEAEILWGLYCVMFHLSFNSSADITNIFKAIFPDSAVIQKMKFGPNKLPYLICFGIAPYFKQQLLMELKEIQCFVISFAESLTNEFCKEQMDFCVMYFNKDRVVCWYLTLRFLGQLVQKISRRNLKKASKN